MKGLVEIEIRFNDDPYETLRKVVEVKSEKTPVQIMKAFLQIKYPDRQMIITPTHYVELDFSDIHNTYTITEFKPLEIA